MGTPEFATTILQALHEKSNHEVVGVVTTTDKPAGRGQKLKESHVKAYAARNMMNILQPERLKDENFIDNLKKLNADLFVVVAFRMLPKVVWEIPPKGTINLHGSLLPKYRGAAPINWAVINGEKTTGVTTFFINEKIDTGDIILQDELVINENDTAGEVHDNMMHLGAKTVLKTVDAIANDDIERLPQKSLKGEPTQAPKIFKNDCKIDFDKNAQELHNFIRGMSPFPGSWMKIKHNEKTKIFKIYRSINPIITNTNFDSPLLYNDGEKLFLRWRNNEVELQEIQLEGKKRMASSQFLQGFKAENAKIIVN